MAEMMRILKINTEILRTLRKRLTRMISFISPVAIGGFSSNSSERTFNREAMISKKEANLNRDRTSNREAIFRKTSRSQRRSLRK